MACISGVQPLAPENSFGSAPLAMSARICVMSPSRAASLSGENGAKCIKIQKKRTMRRFMIPIWDRDSIVSSTLCYKVQRRPDLDVDEAALLAKPRGDSRARHEVNADSFFRFGGAMYAQGTIETHLLRRNAGRCRTLRNEANLAGDESRLLFELLRRRARRIILGVVADESCRQIDHARIDRPAILLDEDQLIVVRQRDDCNRFLPVLALDELPSVALDDENVFAFEDRVHAFSLSFRAARTARIRRRAPQASRI